MRFYVNIELEGTALANAGSTELARMLRKIADDVENSQSTDDAIRGNIALIGAFPVRDANGNTIGVNGFCKGF